MPNEYWRDGIEKYIDDSIEDPWLREMDWNITVAILLRDWNLVLETKWRRAVYMTKG